MATAVTINDDTDNADAAPSADDDIDKGGGEPAPISASDRTSHRVLDSLLAEISFLQEKVLFLKGADGNAAESATGPTKGQNWVKRTEEKANEWADERADFGNGGGPIGWEPMPKNRTKDYRISATRPEGKPTRRWFRNVRERDIWLNMGSSRQRKGQRIPTSLRPVQPSKLGPPNQWDEDDSSQWDSDDSTRTRDFDYFQARLRGDYEWEIDRLNAQKKRYTRLKKKRDQERRLRLRKGQHWEGQKNSDTLVGSLDEASNEALLKNVEWDHFKTIFWSSHTFKGIYVLDDEPRISTNIPSTGNLFAERSAPISAVSPILSEYNGTSPLPERISIWSSELIRLLSKIGDVKIPVMGGNADNANVVLLRPYRFLTYHDADIRLLLQRLDEEEKLLRQSLLNINGPPLENSTDEANDQHGETRRTNSASEEQLDPESADGEDEDKTMSDASSLYSRHAQKAAEARHVACLVSFMDGYIGKRVSFLRSASCDRIYFSDIWHMYAAGDLVISSDSKQTLRVLVVRSGKHRGKDPYYDYSKRDPYDERSEAQEQNAVIVCVRIGIWGKMVGPLVQTFSVRKFDGERLVANMPVIPIRHMHRSNLAARSSTLHGSSLHDIYTLRKRLVDRGRFFLEITGIKHMFYAGSTVANNDEVESQVIIDSQQAFKDEDIKKAFPGFSNVSSKVYESRQANVDLCTWECCDGQNVYDDSHVEDKAHEKYLTEMRDGQNASVRPSLASRDISEVILNIESIIDDDLMIMPYCVHGYVLRNRSWELLDLDFLSSIRSHRQNADTISDSSPGDNNLDDNDRDTDSDNSNINGYSSDSGDIHGPRKTAFSSLVLPDGHKHVVLSLVSQHFRSKLSKHRQNEKVDIIKGKGKGLIILLHEGVAEQFKKPLIQITCGDLGTTAKEVEKSLQNMFTLASRWDCILLLDEAEIFLAARGRNDFTRNGMVAVFLRTLEYYAGILFLTTNRIGDIDEAFISRIHMILYYPQLEEAATAEIFRLNLSLIRKRYKNAGRPIKIDEIKIEQHMREYWRANVDARWNGRQIRNACQTALALAEYDAQPSKKKYDLTSQADAGSDTTVHLRVDHILQVSAAYLEFYKYLKSVHGASTETRARELGLRAMELAEENAVGDATTSSSLRPGRMKRGSSSRGAGRRSGGAGGGETTPLNEFRLSSSTQLPIRQPQQQPPQHQNPHQYPQQQYQHTQQLNQYQYQQNMQQHQQYQPQPGASQQMPYQPQQQFAPAQPYAQPTPQPVAQTVPQSMPQNMAQPSPQQPADVPRTAAYPGQTQPATWSNPVVAVSSEQQYQSTVTYVPSAPTVPSQPQQ